MPDRRPPKRDLADALKLIHLDADRSANLAIGYRDENMPARLGADYRTYALRMAGQSERRAERMRRVAEWLEGVMNDE